MNEQRQTGRTTRMLRQVIEAQKQDAHCNPIVVVGNYMSIPYMRNRYLSLGGDPKRISFTSSPSSSRGMRKQHIYYDHYYYEVEAERMRRKETEQ